MTNQDNETMSKNDFLDDTALKAKQVNSTAFLVSHHDDTSEELINVLSLISDLAGAILDNAQQAMAVEK